MNASINLLYFPATVIAQECALRLGSEWLSSYKVDFCGLVMGLRALGKSLFVSWLRVLTRLAKLVREAGDGDGDGGLRCFECGVLFGLLCS